MFLSFLFPSSVRLFPCQVYAEQRRSRRSRDISLAETRNGCLYKEHSGRKMRRMELEGRGRGRGGGVGGSGSGSEEGRSTCETLESVVSKCACARGKKEKKKERSSSIEGQSMAARARRRNISEKMRELERLIPSEKKKKGMRVESVKMLEEAIKYVRFLKAQVDAVEESCEGEGGGASALAKQRLGRLLMSPAIQRNLYTHQCCIRLFIANYSHSHAPPHFTD